MDAKGIVVAPPMLGHLQQVKNGVSTNAVCIILCYHVDSILPIELCPNYVTCQGGSHRSTFNTFPLPVRIFFLAREDMQGDVFTGHWYG